MPSDVNSDSSRESKAAQHIDAILKDCDDHQTRFYSSLRELILEYEQMCASFSKVVEQPMMLRGQWISLDTGAPVSAETKMGLETCQSVSDGPPLTTATCRETCPSMLQDRPKTPSMLQDSSDEEEEESAPPHVSKNNSSSVRQVDEEGETTSIADSIYSPSGSLSAADVRTGWATDVEVVVATDSNDSFRNKANLSLEQHVSVDLPSPLQWSSSRSSVVRSVVAMVDMWDGASRRMRFRRRRTRSQTEIVRENIWKFLEQPDGSIHSQIFHGVWALMIIASVINAITADLDYSDDQKIAMSMLELVCTCLFTIEFIVRFMVAGNHMKGFVKDWYTLIDIGVISQGWFSIIVKSQLAGLRLMKTQAPILRLLKIVRFSPKWSLLIISLGRCVDPLLVPLYLLVLLVTSSGSLLFWVETNFPDCEVNRRGDVCPDDSQSPAFLSIPHAMWFVVVTISTVGYGDVYPKSDPGRAISAILIIVGACYFALPLSIIGHQFGHVWNNRASFLVKNKIRRNMGGRAGVNQVRALFEEFDVDGNGELTFEELELIVDELDLGLIKRDVTDIFTAIDKDGSGNVTADEFMHFIQSM